MGEGGSRPKADIIWHMVVSDTLKMDEVIYEQPLIEHFQSW